jgi:rod shape-determining protein MreC
VTLTRRARELVLVATLLALPLLFLRANLKNPGNLNALDRAILRISAPLQAALTWSARGIAGGWTRYVWLVGVEEKNRALGDENAKLRSELARLGHDNSQKVELEKLIGLSSRISTPSITARVVAVETSSFFRVVRIKLDVGDTPVKNGMPVLAPEGVVGRVQRAYGRWADVLLAVDPKSSIDVVVARTKGRGTLKGIPADNRYRTRLANFLRKDEVAEGDEVVTTGADAFPRNLAVGKVARVSRRDSGLWQEVEVEPAVDFARLSEVVVLLVNVDEVVPSADEAKKDEPKRERRQ